MPRQPNDAPPPRETIDRFRAWTDAIGVAKAAEEVRRRGCPVDDSYFSHMRRGARGPGLRLAVAIERASAGWVHGPIAAREWVALIPSEEAAAA